MQAKRDYGRERYERGQNKQRRVLSFLNDTGYVLRSGAHSFEWELARMGELYAMPEYKALTAYQRGYVAARQDALRDKTWHEDTVGAIFWRGRILIGRDAEADITTGTWSETRYLGRVWKHAPEKFYTMDADAHSAIYDGWGYPAMDEDAAPTNG